MNTIKNRPVFHVILYFSAIFFLSFSFFIISDFLKQTNWSIFSYCPLVITGILIFFSILYHYIYSFNKIFSDINFYKVLSLLLSGFFLYFFTFFFFFGLQTCGPYYSYIFYSGSLIIHSFFPIIFSRKKHHSRNFRGCILLIFVFSFLLLYYSFTEEFSFLFCLKIFSPLFSLLLLFLYSSFYKTRSKDFVNNQLFTLLSTFSAFCLSLIFLIFSSIFSNQPQIEEYNFSTIILCIIFGSIAIYLILSMDNFRSNLFQFLSKYSLNFSEIALSFLLLIFFDLFFNFRSFSYLLFFCFIFILLSYHLILFEGKDVKGETILPTLLSYDINYSFLNLLMKRVYEDKNSRRILIYLTINFIFMFVEAIYGYMTNSLGLFSDAGHMLFDCTALLIGLYASCISQIPPDRKFTYGYSRYETLSGFINGIFLIIIAWMILVEAIFRLVHPEIIDSNQLILVSVLGLLVNLIGIFFFHHATHNHSHQHDTCNHHHNHDDIHSSHEPEHNDSHNHSHGSNSNILGIYLHILADTLGSVGVIISSCFVSFWQWYWTDALCSIFISIMIVLSVKPLIEETVSILLITTSSSNQSIMEQVLKSIQSLKNVIRCYGLHCWEIIEEDIVYSLHVVIDNSGDEQAVLHQVLACFHNHHLKTKNICIQIEKEGFLQTQSNISTPYQISNFTSQDITIMV